MLKMAFGKYFRHERQASTYCFKGTVAIFVGFCVLAVWMINSSSPVPAERKSFTTIRRPKFETAEKVNGPVTFEDNPGDLPDDAIKGDDGESEKTTGAEQKPEPRQISDGNEEKISDESEDNTPVRNEEKTADGNEQKISDRDEEKASDENEEKTSDENEDKPSVENEEETLDVNEDTTSVGNEEKTSDENEEKSFVRDEKASDEGIGSNEEKPLQKDSEKVIVSEGNEKMTQTGVKDAESQEKEGAENKSQPEKEEGNGGGGNGQVKVKEEGEKTEGEAGNGGKQETEVKEAESQEKEAENKIQSEKDENNGEDRNGKGGVKEEGEKTEGEVGNGGKQEARIEEKVEDSKLPVSLPNGQFELLKENIVEPKNWETQAAESKEEKERQEMSSVFRSKDDKESSQSQGKIAEEPSSKEQSNENIWQLCNVRAGADYIPCLDNEEAIGQLQSTKHYEHRERHCPKDPPTCLVPLSKGYRWPIHWPLSRDKIWYNNVPHTKLAKVKGHQNWVKQSGEYLTFPGGGTQFINGALHYIDFIEETVPDIAWGKHSRVILDVGCGVASFGGFLFEKEVLTMSLAPKDEHEAQVQFALERGIPAILAVMGTQRLPFPSAVFDIVHCARCRVPWHDDGGMLLLEINRLLRPGGYFVWSATPIYRSGEVDVQIWNEMSLLTSSICWSLIAKEADPVNEISVAIYQKPMSNTCYESRRRNEPPLCEESDDPNAAWYVPLKPCLHRVPTGDMEHGTEWPEEWPQRLEKVPSWLDNNLHAAFTSDTEYWKQIVGQSYLPGLGIDWSGVRNVMDMKSVYGGFAAALQSQQVWVMNVVPIDAPNTLPIIYERGLFGIYHDWCESFNTYPRTYDLLHADHLFSGLKKRCTLVSVMTEVDRILRPGGSIIFRDKVETLNELETLMKSLHWQIRMRYSQQQEGIISARKGMWRPQLAS